MKNDAKIKIAQNGRLSKLFSRLSNILVGSRRCLTRFFAGSYRSLSEDFMLFYSDCVNSIQGFIIDENLISYFVRRKNHNCLISNRYLTFSEYGVFGSSDKLCLHHLNAS